MLPDSPNDFSTDQIVLRHQEAVAALEAQLNARSPQRARFDEFVLREQRKGKPYKIAARRAAIRFPLPAEEQTAFNEEFYKRVLAAQSVERTIARVREVDARISQIDQQIASHLKEIAERSANPADLLKSAARKSSPT